MLSAKVIRNTKKVKYTIPEESETYKWWCNEELLTYFINNINKINNTNIDINDVKKYSEKNTDGMDLYCVYVGQSKKSLKKRISKNHVHGPSSSSTLRRTLWAIEKGSRYVRCASTKVFEKDINDVIDKMFVDWCEVPIGKIDCKEKCLINEYLRIFNKKELDDNKGIFANDPKAVSLRKQIVGIIKNI